MASSDQTSKLSYTSKYGAIKKLDGTNYTVWKGDVTVILQVMDALNIVIGEEVEPPAGNTAAARNAIADYAKRRALATTAIRFSCIEVISIYIQNLTNPTEMWEILREKLDSTTSFIGRAAIARKFRNARIDKGEGISVYIARLQSYRIQLQVGRRSIRGGVFLAGSPTSTRVR